MTETRTGLYGIKLSCMSFHIPLIILQIPISDFVVGVKHSWLYEDSISLLGLTVAL